MRTLVPVLLLIFFAGSSCFNGLKKKTGTGKEPLYQTSDLTPEGLFTGGIEGPAVDMDGRLYVVNYERSGTVGVVQPGGATRLFVELPEGSVGNGIRFHSDRFMLIADYTGHNILAVDMTTGYISEYAHGPFMNQPNDLAISANNTLYLSDPNWETSTGNLWRVDPDGTVVLLEENMGTTNGVEVSPGGKTLYVNESVQRKIWAYDILEDGSLTNKRLFYEFEDFGLDGMRCDNKGNLYTTRYGKGTVAILSPKGKLIREVDLVGKNASNIAFGGPDGRTCYVTLQDRGCIETFRTKYPGRDW